MCSSVGGSREERTVQPVRSVSVIIPCRNEAECIVGCLDSVLAGTYPTSCLEILVVDGMSEDGTRDIVEKYAEQHDCIRLLDNVKKVTPTALNIGLGQARGEVVIRMDAHTAYCKDYITKCVESLYRFDADNVGGVCRTVPRRNTLVGTAIAAISSHVFGVGNSRFRIGTEGVREVDTVPFGCYRRSVFERLGGFNEDLVCSQDYEFNLRLRNAGGRVLLVPDIVSEYRIRSTFRSFLRHRLRDGFWTVYPLRYGLRTFGLRHLVPLFFVVSLTALTVLDLMLAAVPVRLVLSGFLTLYVALALTFSARIALANREARLFPFLLILFPALHITYGLGELAGVTVAAIAGLGDSFRQRQPPARR